MKDWTNKFLKLLKYLDGINGVAVAMAIVTMFLVYIVGQSEIDLMVLATGALLGAGWTILFLLFDMEK